MDWRDIPSLAALRAVEAAARCRSFSKAAEELNVTHAAIAQHLRAIEAQLGAALMRREGRGMVLTDTGRQLGGSLSEGFGIIASGVRAVAAEVADRPLSISVTPSFAENWLMPRLAGFWATHPGLGLSINPSTGVVDLRRDGFDLAIRYGQGDWLGVQATRLADADFTVIAAPSLLQGRKAQSLADVSDLPWLFELVHGEARQWVTEAGLNIADCQMNEVATLSMLLSAVRAGGGVSVASSALVADDIAAGRLVAVVSERREGLAYYIVHPPDRLTDPARIFKKWLLTQMG
ncbi:LysR family transcriptional regulator [Loktanella agnita]|uniref:LysR family transcriptional regulator n=1 Tax=Loktanella agnita TaxID=287097 RepID=UPI00398648AF